MPRERDTATNRRSFLKLAGAAGATAATGSVAGCLDSIGGGDGDGDEFEITITQGTEWATLDPVDHNDTPTWNVLNQAYESFLDRNRDGELVANVVDDWERLDDNTVELTVRDDVVFHNGDDLTAEDVAFSINRTNDPDVSTQAGVIGDIDEATATGDGTVELSLNAVVPAIFANLAAFGRVQQQEWVEDRDGDELATDIMGTGPYELEEFDDGNEVVYTKFDDYWGDEPDVDRVTFNFTPGEGERVSALQAGDTDLITNVNPADIGDIEDEDGTFVSGEPSIRNIFLVMPNDDAPFDSEEFRQAMNYAVDVESIIDSLLNEFGNQTSQPTLEGFFGYNPDVDPYPHDPEQAEELIEESGYEGEEIEIHTPTGRYLRDTDVAAAAAENIDSLSNVSASHRERDTQELFSETDDGDMSTAPDIFLIGWGNPTFDTAYAMNPWFLEGAFYHFEDEDIQELLLDAEEEPDEDAREELLQEANRLANERAAWVFLHQQYSIYGVNSDLDWEARQDEDIRVTEISQA